MKTAAIVAEYNPFHNGHAYHIEQTRNKGYSHIIIVMSGNYVQRGSPAILDRFSRARAAVQCGADLVIELPLPWSSSSAPDFADGAIQIVKACGIVDALSFGCEHDDIALIKKTIQIVQSEQLQDIIKTNIQLGYSYPVSVANAVHSIGVESINDFLKLPNNVLALEYCKRIEGSSIIPLPIKRFGCAHDSDHASEQFSSASYIRKCIYDSICCDDDYHRLFSLMPQPSVDILRSAITEKNAPLDNYKFNIAAISRLHALSPQEFSMLSYVSNGMERRLFNAVQSSASLDEACDSAKNKQVTHARIRRTLLQAVLGAYKNGCMSAVPYIRVLALNNKGRELLKSMQKVTTLPIIMRHSDSDKLDRYGISVYDFNQRANDFYNICLPIPKTCGYDKTRNIYIAK